MPAVTAFQIYSAAPIIIARKNPSFASEYSLHRKEAIIRYDTSEPFMRRPKSDEYDYTLQSIINVLVGCVEDAFRSSGKSNVITMLKSDEDYQGINVPRYISSILNSPKKKKELEGWINIIAQ